MNICILNGLYFPNLVGGAERSVQLLAESLAAEGHNVHVVCAAQQATTFHHNNVQIHAMRVSNLYWPYGRRHNSLSKLGWHSIDSYNWWMKGRIGQLLKSISPEVLHTNNLAGFSVGAWVAARALSIPVVHTSRDYYLMCARSTMFRGGRQCTSQCTVCGVMGWSRLRASALVDVAVAVSSFTLNKHLERNYFPNAATAVVYNGLPDVERTGARARPTVTDAAPTFGFIGRLHPSKGLDLLVESFRKLSTMYRVKLVIAGSGAPGYEQHLRRLTARLDVQFLGHVPPEQFYPRVDVLVVPSLWDEPFPRVTFEAYAHGVPVIASARGGCAEAIDVGVTGLVFDPGGPDELFRAMEQFGNGSQKTDSIRDNCLEKAKNFSAARVRESYLALYEVAIKRANARCRNLVSDRRSP